MPQKIHPNIADDAAEFLDLYTRAFEISQSELITRSLRRYYKSLSKKEQEYLLQFKMQKPKQKPNDADDEPLELTA